ncbi:hypothetical protein L2E82_48482 [Cichorium intybus]|uniref:Uncharacterized protein n=1 Tax=Cichorium intybus TaxID=13427 RepID=A0ACB8YYE9_CICIN|nr:hypothetical protein L2E82_48482 [Cichorium intybus]
MGLIMTGGENGCAKVVYASCSVGEALEQETRKAAKAAKSEEKVSDIVTKEQEGLHKKVTDLMKKGKLQHVFDTIFSDENAASTLSIGLAFLLSNLNLGNIFYDIMSLVSIQQPNASNDLPRAAETLANMRHCLTAVGEVAEFANIRRQLQVLEDRLDYMVQPRQTNAITNHKVNIAQDLREILIRIGRYKSLESHYTKVHLKPIRQLWEDYELKQQQEWAINMDAENGHAKFNMKDFNGI